MTPHPLLGVPVVFLAGDRWVSGAVTNVVNHTVSIRQHASPCASLTYPFSDEGTTWRRAGVEYPEAVAAPEAKSLGQVAWEAVPGRGVWSALRPDTRNDWDRSAQAVIAAYEAGKPKVQYETVTRWAVRDVEDGTWWNGFGWGPKQQRALCASRDLAVRTAREFVCTTAIVPVRRRVKVKP